MEVLNFETELKRARVQNRKERENNLNSLEYVGDMHYSMFCCWCNAFHPQLVEGSKNEIDFERMKKAAYTNTHYFREYCKKEKFDNPRFSATHIKKYIAEKYLGIEYYLDENRQERIRKKVTVDSGVNK